MKRISTLDPPKLAPWDWVDISGLKTARVQIGKTKSKGLPGLPLDYKRCGPSNRRFPWPPSARGFFYFHRPQGLHPAAGSLRFRSVESPAGLLHAFDTDPGSDPALSNARGFDLTVDAGGYTVPWSIPLLGLRRTPLYSRIWNQLHDDGFMTPQLSDKIDSLLQGLPESNGIFEKDRKVIEDINDLLILNLDHSSFKFTVLADDKIYHLVLKNLSVTETGRAHIKEKFKQGVVLAHFELDDKRQLVLRVSKYLVPPDPDLIAANLGQREGELLLHHMRAERNQPFDWAPPRPWSVDPHRFLSPASVAALASRYP
ncbi:hypothetical protein BKA70DRAFT_1321031 [Coprinopsis sp. MPI-PUGE-AT-0042]|nr:hypothetical protein BKA70DRAFT_1321031 [Coprinopsis sp. MPI-PUGE-AT-0042]